MARWPMIRYGKRMAYRFEKSDASVEAAVQRIAVEQAADALKVLAADSGARRRGVHRIRTTCKRLRALVKLVRPAFDGADDVNALLRETSAGLAVLREATVARETFAALIDTASEATKVASAPFAKALDAAEEAAAAEIVATGRLDQATVVMHAIIEGARTWKLDRDGFDAIDKGLRRSFRRASRALAAVSDSIDAEAMHEWRKAVKAHGFHMRLLRAVDPSLAARTRFLTELGDLLGEHHDLDAIEAWLTHRTEADAELLGRLFNRISERRALIEADALERGAVLFDVPCKVQVRRWGRLFEDWHGS